MNGGVDVDRLNAFSGKELQNFIALTMEFESAGITDVRFIRERIQNKINSRRAFSKFESSVYKRNGTFSIKPKKCPSCKTGSLINASGVDGVVLICKECSYSEYHGE